MKDVQGFEPTIKLIHNLVEFVDCPKQLIGLNLLRYNEDLPESSGAQFKLSAGRKDKKKVRKIVDVKQELDKVIGPVDVILGFLDKITAYQPI